MLREAVVLMQGMELAGWEESPIPRTQAAETNYQAL